jgi:hypothetical protein
MVMSWYVHYGCPRIDAHSTHLQCIPKETCTLRYTRLIHWISSQSCHCLPLRKMAVITVYNHAFHYVVQ